MWKMFESDFLGECGDDACDGPGPPPKFHLPPPPRPPFMQDLNAVLGTNIECTEDPAFDMDVCAAFPVSVKICSILFFASSRPISKINRFICPK